MRNTEQKHAISIREIKKRLKAIQESREGAKNEPSHGDHLETMFDKKDNEGQTRPLPIEPDAPQFVLDTEPDKDQVPGQYLSKDPADIAASLARAKEADKKKRHEES